MAQAQVRPARGRRFQWILLAAFGALISGCKFFSMVIIPTTDTTAPVAVASVYDVVENTYPMISLTRDGSTFVATDPNKTYMALAAAYDSGGAKQVDIWGFWTTYCSAKEVAPYITDQLPTKYETAPDHIAGDSVSNGLWTYFPVRFSLAQIARCPGGRAPHHLGFRWFVDALDYHGNTSWNQSEILYYPR